MCGCSSISSEDCLALKEDRQKHASTQNWLAHITVGVSSLNKSLFCAVRQRDWRATVISQHRPSFRCATWNQRVPHLLTLPRGSAGLRAEMSAAASCQQHSSFPNAAKGLWLTQKCSQMWTSAAHVQGHSDGAIGRIGSYPCPSLIAALSYRNTLQCVNKFLFEKLFWLDFVFWTWSSFAQSC